MNTVILGTFRDKGYNWRDAVIISMGTEYRSVRNYWDSFPWFVNLRDFVLAINSFINGGPIFFKEGRKDQEKQAKGGASCSRTLIGRLKTFRIEPRTLQSVNHERGGGRGGEPAGDQPRSVAQSAGQHCCCFSCCSGYWASLWAQSQNQLQGLQYRIWHKHPTGRQLNEASWGSGSS